MVCYTRRCQIWRKVSVFCDIDKSVRYFYTTVFLLLVRKSLILTILFVASLTSLIAVLYSTTTFFAPTINDTPAVYDDMKLEISNSDIVDVYDSINSNKTSDSFTDEAKHYTINAVDTPVMKEP